MDMRDDDCNFLRMAQVTHMVALSKTEIYRQIAKGTFPAPRPFPENPTRRFWVAGEVRRWQEMAIGGDDKPTFVCRCQPGQGKTELISNNLEFWRVKRVAATLGLSVSEIYRMAQAGLFPKARAYPHAPTRKFWLSAEIRRWQVEQVGDEFEALLG